MEVCIISEKIAYSMSCEDNAVWIGLRVMSIVIVGRISMTRPIKRSLLARRAKTPHTSFVLPGTAIGGSGTFTSQS